MILAITTEPDLNKIVLSQIGELGESLPGITEKALSRIAKGVHRKAYEWLSGPGYKYEQATSRKTGKTYRKKVGKTATMAYPVPVRTGHLRRSLDWLAPGETKSNEEGQFTAGENEAIVYNSAIYASNISSGRLSWKQSFLPRPFLDDAFDSFNQSGKIVEIVEGELESAIVRKAQIFLD